MATSDDDEMRDAGIVQRLTMRVTNGRPSASGAAPWESPCVSSRRRRERFRGARPILIVATKKAQITVTQRVLACLTSHWLRPYTGPASWPVRADRCEFPEASVDVRSQRSGGAWDCPRPSHRRDTAMPTGTIARLLIDKGFGFIRDEGGIEHFFHRSAVRQAVFELLREGQRVEFTAEESTQGSPRRGRSTDRRLESAVARPLGGRGDHSAHHPTPFFFPSRQPATPG